MINYDTWGLLLTSKEKPNLQNLTLKCAWRGLVVLLSGRTLPYQASDPGLTSILIPTPQTILEM